jgi:molecular chaperone HtpG
LLTDADVVVIIGASLLHDIAMHLRVEGFLTLVAKDSRFKPLAWFKENQDDHVADQPWFELWEAYSREAGRFSARALGDIIGLGEAKSWSFKGLPDKNGQWTRNDSLIVGEFIRRHHARLAHEIAFYGFPGLPVGSGTNEFPAMGQDQNHALNDLADMIGLTARSHGTSLRVCTAYLKNFFGNAPRPNGSAVVYPMALLRVADYLQIDSSRAPAVLLQLHNPQSPRSIQEWANHGKVAGVGPGSTARSKFVTVRSGLTLELYLLLKELLSNIQSEIDHATVVLDDVYGTRFDLGLQKLNLQTRRVESNLKTPAFQRGFDFVPERTGFSTDPNLLTLLVEPLYGEQPGVGVRELMQNAVDAVQELQVWCKARGKTPESIGLATQDSDVLFEYIHRGDDSWLLRVQDKGIGMTAETIQNYFLRAGASFRRSSEWENEFLEKDGTPKLVRAGRFGIGAFAIFLLGSKFRIWTRHVSDTTGSGFYFEVEKNSQLIPIRCQQIGFVGTRIEVELSAETIRSLDIHELNKILKTGHLDVSRPVQKVDWYGLELPTVAQVIIEAEDRIPIRRRYNFSYEELDSAPYFFSILAEGFDSIYWSFKDKPNLICNGMLVSPPGNDFVHIDWSVGFLRVPSLIVSDGRNNLPLTTQRYSLQKNKLPFENELARDVVLSFIAHALICGPKDQKESLFKCKKHPLQGALDAESKLQMAKDGYNSSTVIFHGSKIEFLENMIVAWCVNSVGFFPSDPWFFSVLKISSQIVFGRITQSNFPDQIPSIPFVTPEVGLRQAIMPRNLVADSNFGTELMPLVLTNLVFNGSLLRKRKVSASQVLASVDLKCNFFAELEKHEGLPENIRIDVWTEQSSSTSRHVLYAHTGPETNAGYLQQMLQDFEAASSVSELAEALYVAEIYSEPEILEPVSLLSQLWLECLGAQAIPFDPDARQALIEEVRKKHSDLDRHLSAWEEMKSTDSIWANLYER